MRGSLRQRGETTWELRAYGAGRRVTRTFHGSRRAAESALAALVADVGKGRAVANRGRTVADLLRQWHEARSADWSPENQYEHRRQAERIIIPALGGKALASLSTSDVDAFYGALRRRGLSPGYVRRIHSTFRSALQQGVVWGWLGVNPAATAKLPPAAKPTIRPPSGDELVKLLEALVHDPDLLLYIHCAAATGARRSELCRLMWADVDLDAGELVIHKGKTEASTRRMAIDAVTLDMLRAHRTLQKERAMACGVRVARHGYVFSFEADAALPWKPDRVTHAFIRLRRRAGVEGVRLHDLRHYVATSLIAAGVDVRTVAERLGHASPYHTLNTYAHFVPASDRAAAELLARILREQATGKTDISGQNR